MLALFKNRGKSPIFFILPVLLIILLYPANASSDYNNPLTRSIADRIYCLITGCTINGDINIQGSAFLSQNLLIAGNILSIRDQNLTGNIVCGVDGTCRLGNDSNRFKSGNFSGTVQAGSFVGDGSQLTNVAGSVGVYSLSNFTTNYDARTDRFGNANFTSQLSSSNVSTWKVIGNNITNLNSGNIGIGTSSPVYLVDVNKDYGTGVQTVMRIANAHGENGVVEGTRLLFGAYTGGGRDSGAIDVGTFTDLDSMYMALQVRDSSNTLQDRLHIINTGNVGLGTANPLAKLNINQTSTSTNPFADDLAAIHIMNDGQTDNNYAQLKFTGLDSNGNLFYIGGIAAQAPSHTAGATTGQLIFATRPSGGGLTSAIKIDTSQNVNITNGELNLPAIGASGVGDTYVCRAANNDLHQGATCAASTIDIKENITELGDVTSRFMKIGTYNFKYKKGYYGERKTDGFIVEQLVTLFPECTFKDENNKTYAPNDNCILANVVKVVQEQQKQIDELKK